MRGDPTMSALGTDYVGTMMLMMGAGHQVVTWDVYWRRLEGCRRCPRGWWDESHPDGRGRCQDVRRACAQVRLWAESTRCGLPDADRPW